jgi:hypothetical protein
LEQENPDRIQWINELAGIHEGKPGFVIGNGWSIRYYDTHKMAEKGILIGCNLAFTVHPIDYLIWQDSAINLDCFKAKGCVKLAPIRKRKHAGHLAKQKDVYYFGFGKRNKVLGSLNLMNSGGLALQALSLFGCNPIFLVGCDCELIRDGTEVHGNIFKDKQAAKATVKGRCVIAKEVRRGKTVQYTTNALYKFSKCFERLEQELTGRDIYKMGDFGIVRINSVDIPEFWSDNHPKSKER